MKSRHRGPLEAVFAVALWLCALGQRPLTAQGAREIKDLVYATVDGTPLALDLYLPPADAPQILVVWVHGGAWNTGSKANVPRQLIQGGLAVASVDFRQASQARFPAQVHDIKAAIRFLRASSASDAPLLLFHGDQDPQMPINQSHELQGAYEEVRRSLRRRT